MKTGEKVAIGAVAIGAIGGTAYYLYTKKPTPSTTTTTTCGTGQIKYDGKCITPDITIDYDSTDVLSSSGKATVAVTVKVAYNGNPLKGIYITLMESGNEIDKGLTNSDGEYSVNLTFDKTGNYTIDAYISGTKYE